MQSITLYHGSAEIIRMPLLEKGRRNNDFGQGLYCTQHEDLAKEWACTALRGGYANKYEFQPQKLSIFQLQELPHATLQWLSLLLQNRIVRLSTPLARRGKEWITTQFPVDISAYDAIIGYRADDSYFAFARAFLNNQISFAQLALAMHLGNLGEQYVLKSAQAFKQIEFISAEPAEQANYFPLREARDREAVESFNALLEQQDQDGIYIRDLVEGRVSLNDERLQ